MRKYYKFYGKEVLNSFKKKKKKSLFSCDIFKLENNVGFPLDSIFKNLKLACSYVYGLQIW